MSIRRILEALISHDYRITWQRWAVAAHIALKRDRLFTVEELYTSLKQHYPDIGLTTVYRTLDLLVELGVIDRIHDDEGTARYMLRSPEEESSLELACDVCGSVTPIDVDQLQPLLKAAAQREGFKIHHYDIKLFGVCRNCATRAGDRATD
ncbi:MAG TPA: Fur family transcriptional regulator [Bacillota bacterium]